MRRAALLSIALAGACGGGDEPPPPPEATTLRYQASAAAPCDAVFPTPNDLYADDELTSALSACGLPADPMEAALAQAVANDGWAIETPIRIPFEGVAIDARSLSSSVAFALNGAGTSSTAAPPAVLLLQQTGSATAASGWRVLAASAAATATEITVTPAAPLEPARRHVVILTSSARNTKGSGLAASAATKLLVGAAPIAAGGELDLASATLLERERLRLAGLVALLGAAAPRVPPEKIAAIFGFTTRLGAARLERTVAAYQAALRLNRFPFEVTTAGGDLSPESIDPLYVAVCPAGRTVPGCYDRVRAFRRGVIKVPKLLDADGHLRAGWATTAIETTDVPFLAALPETTPTDGAPVALYIPGHGRSRLDARALANEYAARLGNGMVLAIELAGHGERTFDAATRAPLLADLRANSANPEIDANTPDGIPDASGDAFLSGDPRALRDGQLAATIEVLHVIETLKKKAPFVSQGIEPDARTLHLIAHGQAAGPAVHAAAFTFVRTLVLAAGGAGIRELVSGGPASLKAAFLAKAPVGADRLAEYLGRLETSVLEGASIEDSGARVNARMITGQPSPRVLLNHGERPREVPVAARERLEQALGLPPTRVSQHHGMCDGFFVFTCTAGDQFSWVAGARNQMSTFASSGGVTVVAPAP